VPPENGHAGLSLQLGPDALRPLIAEIVAEALRQLEAARARVPDGRLAYSEEEAARLLGLEPHVLRDERRRGRIGASQVVGRRIRYSREDLLGYLAERRV
jgi:excisionase family DNA binding protein